jgi:uncharacterized protein (DUF885 family)
MTEARELADSYWAYYRRTSQLWNIDRGDVDEIEQWEDLSASGVDTRLARLGEFGARAARVGATNVAAAELSLLAAVAFSAEATAIALPWLRDRALATGPMNFATVLSVLVPNYGLVTRHHGDGYVAKVRGIPSFIDAWIDGMRAGLADGHAASRRGVVNAIAQYDRLLTIGADPLAGQSPPTELSASEADAWRAAVMAAVTGSVRPASAPPRSTNSASLSWPGSTTSTARSPARCSESIRRPRSVTGFATTRACSTRRRTRSSTTSNRPGTFYFDVTDPSRWTRFALAPTTFHEAIPGHHLQLSIAQELQLHPVLGELEVGAFNEGWGLYAERLADEMGLYDSPLQRIGMLTLDSLRAGRLVVDTGIHAKGWTRQRAVDFLHDHTALARDDVEAEIDRYIADPGQAASYMIGRLEIDRLRTHAAQRLGGTFSIPAFHDTILHGGMTPLGDLARRIEEWIDR